MAKSKSTINVFPNSSSKAGLKIQNVVEQRRKDCQRAAVCCLAAAKEGTSARPDFEGYPDLGFQHVVLNEVSINPYGIVVAIVREDRADSALNVAYVAFRGSGKLQNVFRTASSQFELHDEEKKIQRCMKGHLHDGHFKMVEEEFPSLQQLTGFCGSILPGTTIHRFVLCGQGVWGAVGHMILLKHLFLLCGGEKFRREIIDLEPKHCNNPQLSSIAFGAPLFLDKSARDYFTSEMPVSDMFLNYVNDKDPVPFMLHKQDSTAVRSLQEKMRILQDKLNSRFCKFLDGSATKPSQISTDDDEGDEDSGNPRCYVAFGQWIRISIPKSQHLVLNVEDSYMSVSKKWTTKHETFLNHVMERYSQLLLPVKRFGWPTPSYLEDNSPTKVRAYLNILSGEKGGVKIRVDGSNFHLCLMRKCAVSEFEERWEITRLEPKCLVFHNRASFKDEELSVLRKKVTSVSGHPFRTQRVGDGLLGNSWPREFPRDKATRWGN